jgi:hypothetical protein
MTLFTKAFISLFFSVCVAVPTAFAFPHFSPWNKPGPVGGNPETTPHAVPELSASSASSAMAMLAGIGLILAGQRRRIPHAQRVN